MKNIQTLKFISYSLLGTIISLNINIDQGSAQDLSVRKYEGRHEHILPNYAKKQPYLLNSNTKQQGVNSLMSIIHKFEKKNPEYANLSKNKNRINIAFYNNSMDRIREQSERDTEFRMRQMCWGYGGDWDAKRKKCYYD